MVMNLYILFLISLPEAALNLYIILQLAEKKRLNFKEGKNIVGFILTIGLMLISSLIIRPHVPNGMINIIVHSFAYIAIVCVVYKINILKSAFCISLVIMINTAINNIYTPFIVAYISKGYENFSRYYQLFVVYTIPYRLAQIGIIWWINKYDVVFDMIKLNKKFHKLFIVFMYTIISVGFSFAIVFYKYFYKMEFIYQFAFSISISVMLCITSILVFNLIYIAIKGILAGGYRQYQALEEESKAAFKEVYSLLKNKNFDGATEYLGNLLEEKSLE